MSWSSLYFPNYEATHISWYLMNNGHLLIVSVMSKWTVTIVIKLSNRPPIDHYNMSDMWKFSDDKHICFFYKVQPAWKPSISFNRVTDIDRFSMYNTCELHFIISFICILICSFESFLFCSHFLLQNMTAFLAYGLVMCLVAFTSIPVTGMYHTEKSITGAVFAIYFNFYLIL